MADLESMKVCIGCGPTEALAVTMPPMGLCPTCLTARGWSHDATEDVLKRLGAESVPSAPSLEPAWTPPKWRYRVLRGRGLDGLAETLTTWQLEWDGSVGRRGQVLWDMTARESLSLAGDAQIWAVMVAEEDADAG